MIDFIDAHNGGIKMFAGADNIKGWGTSPETIAWVLKTVGIGDTVYGSSSMDFASDYGFDTNDGARKLWNAALKLI